MSINQEASEIGQRRTLNLQGETVQLSVAMVEDMARGYVIKTKEASRSKKKRI